jgi:hypothetical protein
MGIHLDDRTGGITESFADTMNALIPSPIIAPSVLLSEYIGKGQFFDPESTGIEQVLTARDGGALESY